MSILMSEILCNKTKHTINIHLREILLDSSYEGGWLREYEFLSSLLTCVIDTRP